MSIIWRISQIQPTAWFSLRDRVKKSHLQIHWFIPSHYRHAKTKLIAIPALATETNANLQWQVTVLLDTTWHHWVRDGLPDVLFLFLTLTCFWLFQGKSNWLSIPIQAFSVPHHSLHPPKKGKRKSIHALKARQKNFAGERFRLMCSATTSRMLLPSAESRWPKRA